MQNNKYILKELEIEKKFLINEEIFNKIINSPLKYNLYERVDYYFDTIENDFKNNNSALRVRYENNKYYLNLKQKQSNNTNNEYKTIIDEKEFNQLLENKINLDNKIIEQFNLNKKIYLIAKIKVDRYEYKINDNIIDVDKTKFLLGNDIFNETDYEIEIEYKDIEESKRISFFEELKIAFNLSTNEMDNIINNISKPKIARYFGNKQKALENILNNNIFVVEGKSDFQKLSKYFENIKIFLTSGLGIDDNKIKKLKEISEKQKLDIIVFTDPDGPGEKIRKIINEKFNNVKNVHISTNLAKSKKKNKVGMNKVGIEYANKMNLEDAILNLKLKDNQQYYSGIKEKNDSNKYNYQVQDLINNKISGNKQSREILCNHLGIAYGNNKKIVKQLNMYNIKYEEFLNICNKIIEVENE